MSPGKTCKSNVGFVLNISEVQVTRYLGYSSLKDFFPSMDIKPNPGCPNPTCLSLQKAAHERANTPQAIAARAAAAATVAGAKPEQPEHEDNEWDIEVRMI